MYSTADFPIKSITIAFAADEFQDSRILDAKNTSSMLRREP